MLNARHTTSDIYNDHTAGGIAGKIERAYLSELQKPAALLTK